MGLQYLTALSLAVYLCFYVCHGFPAIERPEPTEDDVYSPSRGADDGAQFVVPEGVELPTREGRVLKATTVEDVKEWMADTVADNESVSQSFVLAYAGEVKRVGDILALTAPNGKVFTFKLGKYFKVIKDLFILENTKSIVVEIRKIGKAKRKFLRKFIDALEAVRPIYVIEADSKAAPSNVPSDPMFNTMWHFRNSINTAIHTNAEASWERLGKLGALAAARVAILDDIIDREHKDLKGRFYTNPNETADDTDTDNNGCIDDVHGCDFTTTTADGGYHVAPANHGTHVAGIIGAEGNNGVGVIGLSKTRAVETIPIGVTNKDGGILLSGVVRGLEYAVKNKAVVSNNSYGFQVAVPSLKAALINILDKLIFMNASANTSVDLTQTENYMYPSAYRLPNVLPITSMSINGRLSNFAAYGLGLIGLAAPGGNINSTANYDEYKVMSGTSMATPMVSAAAGQVIAAYPTLTPIQLSRVMTQSVRKLITLQRYVTSGGTLDADRALLFGLCEDAFSKARVTCKATASDADKAKYSSAGAEAADALALQCEGTAAVVECIYKELQKTGQQACYRRTCDITEGQCEDLRLRYYRARGTLPVMKLATCKYGRLVDNHVVMLLVDADSHEAAMLSARDMLTKEVLQTNEEVTMDVVVAKEDRGYEVSAVIDSYSI